MPHALNIILHLKILNPSSSPPPSRSALHVQSRSYWAPANIGPYSQATSTTLSPGATQISIAGQIPLLPSSMSLPGASSSSPLQDFSLQATLALQHLFRIAFATSTRWLPGAIAYLPVSTSLPPPPLLARLLSRTWTLAHEDPTPTSSAPPSPTLDLWAEKHDAAMRSLGREERPGFPDPGVCEGEVGAGPVFVVVVQELPRGAMVEWHALGGVGGEGLKVCFFLSFLFLLILLFLYPLISYHITSYNLPSFLTHSPTHPLIKQTNKQTRLTSHPILPAHHKHHLNIQFPNPQNAKRLLLLLLSLTHHHNKPPIQQQQQSLHTLSKPLFSTLPIPTRIPNRSRANTASLYRRGDFRRDRR